MRRGCVDSDCDWAPTDQRQTGCLPAKSGEAKLEEGSEMARNILTDLPFLVTYSKRNSDFIPNLQPHCLL